MQNIQSLMMVITSDTYPAKRNSNTQKKLYKKTENTNEMAVWYSGGGLDQNEKFVYDSLNRDLKLKCSDDSRQMGQKTILAFEWAIENVDFKYLIRPTPSSFINFSYLKGLYKEILDEKDIVYAGTVQTIEYENKPKLIFVSGSTLILNKQCVELIIKNQNKWDHSLWDDVALSKLMTELEIKPIDLKRFDIRGNIFKQEVDIENYQFRCRADNHYNYPRFIEAYLLKIVHKLVNNLAISLYVRKFYSYYFEVLKLFYIREFSWKVYLKIKYVIKKLLPKSVYNYLKLKFIKNINDFKHKRFKF